MDTTLILKFFFTGAFLTAAIIWIAKLIINKLAEAGLEKYKNSLNLDAERFKSELNKTIIEHQVKYTKLYEERGAIIKMMNNRLYDLEITLADMTTLFQGPEWIEETEKENKSREALNALREEFERNRIFFSKIHCEQIESILNKATNIFLDMKAAKRGAKRIENIRQPGYFTTEELLEPSRKWEEADQKVREEIKIARLDLAEEFRSLIGVQ